MSTSFTLKHTALVIALTAIYPMQASAAVSAGVAQFIAGDVNVRRPDGGTSALAKGKDLESGESILTGVNGRAQVRFSDGGLISLQPNTEFKIANYVDKADPKQDRFLVDLLRGSMRAITGLIGKRNHDNYKVTTTTATIGIRGSGFNVGYNPDGSLGVTTELDAIEVCNAGGCVGLTAGESVRVVNATDAPVRTNVKAAIPTPPPDQDPVVAGNQTKSDGKSAIIAGVDNSGTFSNLKVAATYRSTPGIGTPGQVSAPGVATSATLSDGNLTTFTTSGKVFATSATGVTGSVGSIAAGDFIGWGLWTGATRDGLSVPDFHYIVGQPTVTLPTTATNLTYTLIGGSTVTGYLGNSASASGTLTGGSLVVNFGSSSLNILINTTLGNVSANGVSISAAGNFSYTGTRTAFDGFFTGPNANRAGLVYTGPNSGGTGTYDTFSGAAAFKAP